MRLWIIGLAPLVTALTIPDSRIPATDSLKDKYIITFNQDISPDDFNEHIDWVSKLVEDSAIGSSVLGLGIENTWSDLFQGYSGRFTLDIIELISNSDQINTIEAVKVFSLQQTDTISQKDATWGLASISHTTTGTSDYLYKRKQPTKNGLWAYVLDTGIYTQHSDFEGRAFLGYNAVKDSPNTDTHGHGTHCAGTIASKTFGVAKNANIMGVKVFSGDKSTTDVILNGLQWAVNNITASNRAARSVISLSVGGAKSNAFNTAVNNAYNSGIFVAVAAGNNGLDASLFSPGSAANAFTVGTVDKTNTRPSGTNYGKAISIFAPGVSITSLGISGKDATAVMSGTSMAAPHVAGLALYLMDIEGVQGPAAVGARIKNLGTKNVVKSAGSGSPNSLAYNGVV
ncbi:peptidase S8/S53 domain-containing protein [Dactylonectria estremocensis]|uniref:Peptidase S8/S53 domain-containing protein n=1 Tax=Dactylonectria estremocensis TaxID=1079267 RepID=A0A9P9J120_9HYPO|nr:peptidase S8/S53 domain-containing protein [Dactylonectria estremocensis]